MLPCVLFCCLVLRRKQQDREKARGERQRQKMSVTVSGDSYSESIDVSLARHFVSVFPFLYL